MANSGCLKLPDEVVSGLFFALSFLVAYLVVIPKNS